MKLTAAVILTILSRVARQAVALDLAGSADLAALLVLVTRAEIARAQIADGSVAGVPVITARASLAGGPGETRRATTGLDLNRSPSGRILHGCVHADVADVRGSRSLAVRCADQNSLQIRKHDHEVCPGSAARAFVAHSSPFVFYQWNGVGLQKDANVQDAENIQTYFIKLHAQLYSIK